jgi:DNA-binding protein H-NS
MARIPAEQRTTDDIISQLEGLDAAALGRVVEAAQQLRFAKQQTEREAFIARVREEAAAIGLVPEQLFAPTPLAPKPTPRRRGGGVVAPQFRGPDGSEWSGRGKSPKWLTALEKHGHTRDEFRIKEGQPDLIETTKREHGEPAKVADGAV